MHDHNRRQRRHQRADQNKGQVILDLVDEAGNFVEQLVLTTAQARHLEMLGKGSIERGIQEAARRVREARSTLPPDAVAELHQRAVLEVDLEDSARATQH